MSNQTQTPKSDDQFVILALIFALVMSPVGVVLSHMALNRIKKGLISVSKQGMAIAALVIGYIGTVIWIYGMYLLFLMIYFFIYMYQQMN